LSVDYLITECQINGVPDVRAGLDSLQSGVGETEDRFAGLKGLLAGGLALAGLNALSNDLVQTGNEAANVNQKLEAMLAVRGESGALDEINAALSDLSKQTGIDDDTFADSAAHLLSFGLSAKQVEQILPGITGQADTMGQSLDSVADSFGRAFVSGEAGGLTRSGVVLSDVDKEAIKAASSISALAGQQELFNRVLASYSQYAVAAGAGTTEAARAQGYFATQTGNAMEAVGAAASEARANWQKALTPTIEDLNANHQGLLALIGSSVEYATVAGNVGTPLFALVRGFGELRNYLNLAKLANIAAAGAQNAETAAEARKLPILASETAGHEAATVATLEHAAANRALGAAGGAGVPGVGGAAGGAGLLANPLVKGAGVVAAGVTLGVVGYNATREDGMPSAGEIGGYYKNRLLGQNANEAATSVLGGNPYAAGDDAEKKSTALFDKMREGGGADKRKQAALEASHRDDVASGRDRISPEDAMAAYRQMSVAQRADVARQGQQRTQPDIQTGIAQQGRDRSGAQTFKIEHTVTIPASPGDDLARKARYNTLTPRIY
jgi:hypothetical protein